jgi:transcriptional regulator with XRE-family HTH domain
MDNIREVFSANLRRFRVARGLSQAKLAEKIGSSYHYVGMLETQKKFPSSDMIHKLSSALSIDPTELFSKEISPETTMKNSQKAAFEDVGAAMNQFLSGYIAGKIQKLEEELEGENS